MFSVNLRRLSSITAFCFFAVCFLQPAAQSQQFAPRRIVVNIDDTAGPVDRFFDLSVGSDYPGTLIRDDSQAQLKLVVMSSAFRYIRFHAIFHDVLGTVRFEDGKTVYNWSKIDQLYDDLLARHIRPFVELGFTPKALATSQNSIFIGTATRRIRTRKVGAILSMPSSGTSKSVTEETRFAPGTSKSGTSPTSPVSGKAETRKHTSRSTT